MLDLNSDLVTFASANNGRKWEKLEEDNKLYIQVESELDLKAQSIGLLTDKDKQFVGFLNSSLLWWLKTSQEIIICVFSCLGTSEN